MIHKKQMFFFKYLKIIKLIDAKIENLPKSLKLKLSSYTDKKKITQRIIGYELLEKAIKEHNLIDKITFNDLKYDAFGKPHFLADFDFSISYTQDCVFLCSCENGKIGIDAEILVEKDIRLFEEYFSKKEWKIICSSNQPSKSFFEFWTRKEAFVKAVGIGVYMDLSSFEVIENSIEYNGEKWKIETQFIEEKYILSTVTNF